MAWHQIKYRSDVFRKYIHYRLRNRRSWFRSQDRKQRTWFELRKKIYSSRMGTSKISLTKSFGLPKFQHLIHLSVHWMKKTLKTFKESFLDQTDKNSLKMDEFDIFLESTGSMQTYQDNRMACFRKVLSEPLRLD